LETTVRSKRVLCSLVNELSSEGESLTSRLSKSSEVEQQVVESVRKLDVAQANTRRALARTTDILGLKSCVEEVSSAMSAENWEGAANAIQRFLHVAPEDAQTEENALQSLKRSLVDLKRVAAERCQVRVSKSSTCMPTTSGVPNPETLLVLPCCRQAAADARDDAGVVRFCKLLAQLDMPGEAASRYAQYAGLMAQVRFQPYR
jgi:hypothetical protein